MPGVQTKTRLESRIKTFNPHLFVGRYSHWHPTHKENGVYTALFICRPLLSLTPNSLGKPYKCIAGAAFFEPVASIALPDGSFLACSIVCKCNTSCVCCTIRDGPSHGAFVALYGMVHRMVLQKTVRSLAHTAPFLPPCLSFVSILWPFVCRLRRQSRRHSLWQQCYNTAALLKWHDGWQESGSMALGQSPHTPSRPLFSP